VPVHFANRGSLDGGQLTPWLERMGNTALFIDAHVHIYSCFDLSKFFEYASRNLAMEAGRAGPKGGYCPVLFLTEGSGQGWFTTLRETAVARPGGSVGQSGCSVSGTMESCSLAVRRGNDDPLILIQGRQIVTSERLEVLAIGTDYKFDDGSTMADTIDMVEDKGAVAVIPWGFGKWTGRRGRVLREYLCGMPGRGIFLGDNGGRPSFLPFPGLDLGGMKDRIRVMPGSDPLPFESECRRVGTYGFSVEGRMDHDRPARAIKEILLEGSAPLRPFGRHESPLRFIRNQLAMQIRRPKVRLSGGER